MKEMLVIK